MAYDENLAERIRAELRSRDDLTERKMFGGIAFMVGGNMFCGVTADDLMLRLGAEGAEAALEEPHTRPMDFTGRPMTGYVYVAADGVASDEELRRWIGRALDFVTTLPSKS